MNPDTKNPATNGVAATNRYGREAPGPISPYRAATLIQASESAPATIEGCAKLGKAAYAEFLILKPAWCTQYNAVWGRWHYRGAGEVVRIDEFVPEATIRGLTDSAPVLVRTQTDPVGLYITDIEGEPDDTGFRLFVRAANGP